jgi:hypothetical protein
MIMPERSTIYLKKRQRKSFHFSLKQFITCFTLIAIGLGIQIWANRLLLWEVWEWWYVAPLLSLSGGLIGAGIFAPFKLPWLTYWGVVLGLFLGFFIPMMIIVSKVMRDFP